MKRILCSMLLLLFVCGCSLESNVDRPIVLRNQLIQTSSCSFVADITADYGDILHTFSMECTMDQTGNISFVVTRPETISGITGYLDSDGGKLTFDDKLLAFPKLADGQITPVSAPWVFITALRSGYIAACADEGTYLYVSMDDSYEENPIHLDIWLDEANCPVRAEILYEGKRIVSIDVRSFTFV